jgi:hypothetical protein
MKKKLTVIVLLTAMLLTAFATSVSAVTPAYYYEAQKSVIPVTFTNNVGDWADAVKLVINADNKVFQEYGRFQTDPRVATPDELSCTYYIKWDEEFLYIREERTDKDGLNNPTVDPSGPWMGDGTAFFFADYVDLNRVDIRWIAYTDQRDKKCAVWSQGVGREVTDEWKCAGFKQGDVYTIELAMPWSVMDNNYNLTQEIKEGAEFRFCPIITSRSDDRQYGEWEEDVQINFYDGYHKFELSNSENPLYHAGLKLTAANYTPASDEKEEEAPVNNEDESIPTEQPATNPPASNVNRAPRTGDSMTLILVMLAIAAAACTGFALLRRRNTTV